MGHPRPAVSTSHEDVAVRAAFVQSPLQMPVFTEEALGVPRRSGETTNPASAALRCLAAAVQLR